MVELVGYHGTTKTNAENIMRQKKYNESTKSTEWLGWGVYFFKDEFWARNWSKRECVRKNAKEGVLQSGIRCAKDLFFDLDSVDNKKKMEEMIKPILTTKSVGGVPEFKTKEELRCFYCNYYAIKMSVLVYSCNFPSGGFDDMGFPKSQVQYCVKDNKIIGETKILR